MLRRALPLVLLAALAVLAARALGAAPAAGAERYARAVLLACEKGAQEAERAGVFEGRMRSVAGAERMQMRFALKVRPGAHGRWRAVQAPGFDAWLTSDPGTKSYVYTKRVERLVAPGWYRTVVRFRWLAADGGVLARSRSTSRTCRQPDPRANLVVRQIAVEPTADPARRSYLVLVRNTGRAPSPPSAVSLEVGGTLLAPAEAPALAPRATALVALEGPACEPGGPLHAEADARDDVDERSERDNALSLPCP